MSLRELPNELLEEIVRFLPAPEQNRFSLVSKKMNSIVKSAKELVREYEFTVYLVDKTVYGYRKEEVEVFQKVFDLNLESMFSLFEHSPPNFDYGNILKIVCSGHLNSFGHLQGEFKCQMFILDSLYLNEILQYDDKRIPIEEIEAEAIIEEGENGAMLQDLLDNTDVPEELFLPLLNALLNRSYFHLHKPSYIPYIIIHPGSSLERIFNIPFAPYPVSIRFSEVNGIPSGNFIVQGEMKMEDYLFHNGRIVQVKVEISLSGKYIYNFELSPEGTVTYGSLHYLHRHMGRDIEDVEYFTI